MFRQALLRAMNHQKNNTIVTKGKNAMIVKTRDFGDIEINEKDIISFKEKIFGFEDYSDFVMLFDDEVGNSFGWLQSVEEPEVCFLVANPDILNVKYTPSVSDQTVEALGGEYNEVWLVMTAGECLENSTVNMKSPVVINSSNGFAAQVILEEDYEIRYSVFGKEIA